MSTRVPLICVLMLGLCLALTSVVSAMLMAPEQGDRERAIFVMTFGEGDLCADHDGHGTHEHRCPFCHATPQAPELTAPTLELAFAPHDLWRQGEALHRAAQGRNINHSTRAPPRIV